MNTKKYRFILYFILITIVTTIGVQIYWNYKNYQQNKQRVFNEVQLSLDNAIEEYFAGLAKSNFTIIDTVFNPADSTHKISNKKFAKGFISWKSGSITSDSFINLEKKLTKNIQTLNPDLISDVRIIKKRGNDSIQLIDNLKTIYISISNKTVNYQKLDSLLQNQLKNKQLKIAYSFNHIKNDSIFFHSGFAKLDSVYKGKNFNIELEHFNNVNSKSTYLKGNEQFKLIYSDVSYEALKRSLTGILLSLFLSLAVIFSLFYLLKIINKQKELAEIKNDLISNITHEFKTPITTVSTALEAIENFNAIDDKEKTKKYLSISTLQLKKLHQMVEKLLETATLDSEKLMLQKEEINVVDLIKNVVTKNEFSVENKDIQFSTNKEKLIVFLDPFHFENAISNLIDNAIKYGGNNIEIHVNLVLNTLEITIADNGNAIEKNQREKIFDKFYRIPKGNTHNVKGFGIGLYYTKKIIEKHGGEIQLIPDAKNTIFKITLPV